jgi:hypothetical protein
MERIDVKYLSDYILVGGTKRRKGDKEKTRNRKKRDRYEDEEEEREKKKKKKKKKKGDKSDGESDTEDDDNDDDEDRWVWTENGKKIKYSIDWAQGQPNNSPNERCLALRYTQGKYKFHDVNCDTTKGRYFCQK